MKINHFLNYNNALMPLNEGFFSWLGGILKNLISGIFHVDSFSKFIDRINKMPKIILGIDDNVSSEEKTNESYKIKKRSRFSIKEINESNKKDNLELTSEMENKLKLSFKKILDKEENNIEYNEEEINKIKKKYKKKKLKDDKELKKFIDILNKDGIKGISGFKNKKYYSFLFTIKNIVENDSIKDEDEDEEKIKKDVEEEKSDVKIENMNVGEYESMFKPITYDDLNNNTKMPSFKNTLIRLLKNLNESTIQLNEIITPEKENIMRQNLSQGKVLPLSDIQVIELNVSKFLNLYSSGTMNLPKPEKGESMTISELSQYKNVIDKSDPSKKFASLYTTLKKVLDVYKETFSKEWEFIKEKESEYEEKKAENASWDGDGTISYDAVKKITDKEIEINGALDNMIKGCEELIPNAIVGFFINSPIYKDAEKKIDSLLDILIENEKVIEENKKNPEKELIKIFDDIINNNVSNENEEKVSLAANLFKEKVQIILKKYPEQTDFNNVGDFYDVIRSSGIKINKNENIDTLYKKMNVSQKLAFACLYNAFLNKTIKVEDEINNENVDLFNISESIKINYNKLKKIYDSYICQKY